MYFAVEKTLTRGRVYKQISNTIQYQRFLEHCMLGKLWHEVGKVTDELPVGASLVESGLFATKMELNISYLYFITSANIIWLNAAYVQVNCYLYSCWVGEL